MTWKAVIIYRPPWTIRRRTTTIRWPRTYQPMWRLNVRLLQCSSGSLTLEASIRLNAKLIHLFHWQAKWIAAQKQLHHGKRTNAADEPEVPFDTPILRDLSAFERWRRNAMYLQVNDYKICAELPLLFNIAFLCPTLQLSSPLLSLLYSPLPWLNSSGSQSIMICAILQPFTPKQSLVKRVSFNWFPSEHL